MSRRRLLYWGLPIIGAIIGTIQTFRIGIGTVEAFENQVEAFGGATIWLVVTLIVCLVLS